MERRIGFVGCYSHDVILLLAKVLGGLGKRVLIRDRNKLRTLHSSVPIPEQLCTATATVEYDAFFFTERKVIPGAESYDIEIVDFGMDVTRGEIRYCSDVVVVTDMLLHHVRRLEIAEIPRESVCACILRDALEDICKGEGELRSFLQLFPNGAVYFLPPDYRDVRNRYVCETMHEYSIHKASPEMRDMIVNLVSSFCGEYTEKEVRRSLRRRERRQYR